MSYLLVVVLMFSTGPKVSWFPEPDLATCNAEGVQILRDGDLPPYDVENEFFSCADESKAVSGVRMRGINSVPQYLRRGP